MLLLLGDAVYRLAPVAFEAVTGELSGGQWAALIAWHLVSRVKRPCRAPHGLTIGR